MLELRVYVAERHSGIALRRRKHRIHFVRTKQPGVRQHRISVHIFGICFSSMPRLTYSPVETADQDFIATLNSWCVCNRGRWGNLVMLIRSKLSCGSVLLELLTFYRCDTNNCLPSLVCGTRADAASHLPVWVYVIVGIGIFGGMFGTLFALFFLHRRARDAEREKRTQYWREQVRFI